MIMQENNSLKQKILDILEDDDTGINPTRMAQILGQNKNTVRTAMNRMAKDGLLLNKFRGLNGYYGPSPLFQKKEHGIPNIRAQNIHFVIKCDKTIGKSFEEIEYHPNKDNPLFKVKTFLAKTTNNVSICFSSSIGFGLDAIILAFYYKVSSLNQRFGFSLDINDFELKNIELFNDFFGFGISKNQLFFSDLNTTLLKIYSKKGKTRTELRSSVPVPFEIFLKIINNEPIYIFANQNKLILERLESIEKNFGCGTKQSAYFSKLILGELKNKKPIVSNFEKEYFTPANKLKKHSVCLEK
jgi:hypothetical protein